MCVGRRGLMLLAGALALSGCGSYRPRHVASSSVAPRGACADSMLGRMHLSQNDTVTARELIAHVDRLDACLRQTTAQLQSTSVSAKFAENVAVVAALGFILVTFHVL